MNVNLNKKILTDGDTFLNRWSVFRNTDELDIHISSSNYLLAKELLNESADFLEKYPDKLMEYIEEHLELGFLFGNREVQQEIEDFLNDKNREIFGPILLAEGKSLVLYIYKGFRLEPDLDKDTNLMVSETLAYAQFAYESGVDMPLFTMNEETFEFCKSLNVNFEIADMRV